MGKKGNLSYYRYLTNDDKYRVLKGIKFLFGDAPPEMISLILPDGYWIYTGHLVWRICLLVLLFVYI